MPTMKPYTPPLANTTWDSVYNPQQASIFDSTLEKVVRTLATITGINDPTQIPAALTTVTPAGPATGGLAKVIDDLVKNRQAIKAYHGSPHDFDQFSLDKIGTGEGAQAYGHGLYFAENEGVARGYKEALSHQGRTDVMPIGLDPGKYGMTPESAARVANNWFAYQQVNPSEFHLFRKTNPTTSTDLLLNDIIDGKIRPPGRMYEVAIKASPDDFLDWDKPLSQQSEKVRQAVAATGLRFPDNATGKQIHEAIGMRAVTSADPSERALIRKAESASDALKRAGAKGVKYLDAGSRTAGDGSRNYVVFDDKLVEILRKWGLLPFAVGAGAQQAQTAEAK